VVEDVDEGVGDVDEGVEDVDEGAVGARTPSFRSG